MSTMDPSTAPRTARKTTGRIQQSTQQAQVDPVQALHRLTRSLSTPQLAELCHSLLTATPPALALHHANALVSPSSLSERLTHELQRIRYTCDESFGNRTSLQNDATPTLIAVRKYIREYLPTDGPQTSTTDPAIAAQHQCVAQQPFTRLRLVLTLADTLHSLAPGEGVRDFHGSESLQELDCHAFAAVEAIDAHVGREQEREGADILGVAHTACSAMLNQTRVVFRSSYWLRFEEFGLFNNVAFTACERANTLLQRLRVAEGPETSDESEVAPSKKRKHGCGVGEMAPPPIMGCEGRTLEDAIQLDPE